MDPIERMQEKHRQRIEEFASFGIKTAKGGGVLGSITLYATEAEKVLNMLRRLRRLEAKGK